MPGNKSSEPFWWGLFSVGGVVAALLVPAHLIVLPLYHWAHRFRFILEDLGLHGLRTPIAVLCYGSAVVGTVLTLWILFRL